jgi:hypothetical protein
LSLIGEIRCQNKFIPFNLRSLVAKATGKYKNLKVADTFKMVMQVAGEGVKIDFATDDDNMLARIR